MSKVGDFWKTHTDGEGCIVWPEESPARDALARQLFGICFVEALDYWLAHADDLIDNSPPPSEPWRLATEDPTLRTSFAAMTEEQRASVRKLVRQTVQATLFSSLVHIDQRPAEHFEVKLIDGGQQGLAHPRRVDDLHDELYEWVWQFSVYRDLLISKEKTGRAESVRWKASGDRRKEA